MDLTWRGVTVGNAKGAGIDLNYCSATLVGNLIVMYGGTIGVERQRAMFVLNTNTEKWSEVLPCSGSELPTRTMHTAVLVEDKLFIHGGLSQLEGYTNRLFIFDLVLRTVEYPPHNGEAPRPLGGHASDFFPRRKTIMVFAGMHDPGSGCVFEYDVIANKWSKVSAKGSPPSRRFLQGSARLGSRWFLYGGELLPHRRLVSDLYVLDAQRRVATWSKVELSHPLLVKAPIIALHGKILAFGSGSLENPFWYDPSLECIIPVEQRESDARWGDDDGSKDAERYTINSPLPSSRQASTLVATQHRIYAIGGHRSAEMDVICFEWHRLGTLSDSI